MYLITKPIFSKKILFLELFIVIILLNNNDIFYFLFYIRIIFGVFEYIKSKIESVFN